MAEKVAPPNVDPGKLTPDQEAGNAPIADRIMHRPPRDPRPSTIPSGRNRGDKQVAWTPGSHPLQQTMRANEAAKQAAIDAARTPKHTGGIGLPKDPPAVGSGAWASTPQPSLGNRSPVTVGREWRPAHAAASEEAARSELGRRWGRSVSADEAQAIPGVASRVSQLRQDPTVDAAACAKADAAVPAAVSVRQQLSQANIDPNECPVGVFSYVQLQQAAAAPGAPRYDASGRRR